MHRSVTSWLGRLWEYPIGCHDVYGATEVVDLMDTKRGKRFKGLRRLFAALAVMVLSGLALILVVDWLGSKPPPMLAAPEKERWLTLEGIDIVDLHGDGRIIKNQRVSIADGRIIEVAPAGVVADHRGARVIDARGRFLIPGLWDSHAHSLRLSPQLHFPLSIAQGVTSMRDMGDACSWSSSTECRPDFLAWEKDRAAGRMVAPRIVLTASFHVEEPPASDEDVRRLVRVLKQRGDQMLKLQLPDEDSARFTSLVGAAREAGLPVGGHVPFKADLLDAGSMVHSVEHDWSLLVQCSAGRMVFDGKNAGKAALLKSFDAARCEKVLQAMAAKGAAYVPTHVASSGQDHAFANGIALEAPERIDRFTVWPMRTLWGLLRSAGATDDAQERSAVDDFHRRALALTPRARANGVTLLAGSDALDADVLHGYGLHRELEFLVKAGLTPAQALQAATLAPARFFGEEKDSARIAPGFRADLLILSANPLQDIRNVQGIEWVIADGRVYGPAEREALLGFVERNARDPAVLARFLRGIWRN